MGIKPGSCGDRVGITQGSCGGSRGNLAVDLPSSATGPCSIVRTGSDTSPGSPNPCLLAALTRYWYSLFGCRPFTLNDVC